MKSCIENLEKSLHIKNIETYNPQTLSSKVLGDDLRIVVAWYSQALKGKFKKYSLKQILNLAQKIFEEAIKRGFKLKFESDAYRSLALKVLPKITKKGLYLVPPHGDYIYEGKKTLVVSSKKYKTQNPYLLVSKNKAYGYLALSEPYEITLDEFRKLQSKHRITEEERLSWWKGKNKLYAQDVLWFLPFEKPKKYQVDKGVQKIFEVHSANTFLFLGTGPTLPIPRDGETNPELDEDAKKEGSKSRRTRSSVYFEVNGLGYLIDPSLDFEEQIEKFGINRLDFVFLTHAHRDASGGLKKLIQRFPEAQIFAEPEAARKVKARDSIEFKYTPLKSGEKVLVGDVKVTPLRVYHSIQEGFPTLCFLLEFPNKKRVLYAEDFEEIPEESLKKIRDIDIAILDAAMWYGRQIRGHQNVESAIEWAKKIKPKALILTQLGYTYPPHDKAQEEVSKRTQNLPFPVYLAYDGLKIDLDKKEALQSIEDFYNAHKLILEELKARNLKHKNEDELDTLDLEELSVADLRSIFDKTDSIMIIPQFVSIGGSSVKKDEYNDIDFIIRVGNPEEFKNSFLTSLYLQLRNVVREATSKNVNIHLVESPYGPHGQNVPLYDLILKKRPEFQVEVFNALTVKFVPIKTQGGYGELTFSTQSSDVCWEVWAQGYINQGIPIIAEEKFDGFRLIVRKEGNETKMTSEDTDKPLDDLLKPLREDILKIPHDFILDGELELYADEDIKGVLNFDYKKGEKIERIDMKSFLKKEPAGKYKPKYHAFDIVYYDGKELFDLPYIERRKILEDLIQKTDNLDYNLAVVVRNKKQFDKAVDYLSSRPYSEGVMLKAANFIYTKTGRSRDIAKLKNYKELVVKVVEKTKTKAGTFIYTCALSDGTVIGKTYATDLDVNVGDLLEVRVAEVKYEDGKFTWDNPIVHSEKPKGTQVTTPEQALNLARARRTRLATKEENAQSEEIDTRSERAEKFWKDNWQNMYPKVKKPEFILHQHFRGLVETEIGSFEATYTPFEDSVILWIYDKNLAKIISNNGQSILINGYTIEEFMNQEDLLNTTHSVHGDLRFQTDQSTLHGWTLFYGTTADVKKAGGDRLIGLKENDSLQCAPKLAQPVAWVYLARKKPYISQPGSIGSTSSKYAKFFAIDYGTYEPGTWHRHFFEYFLNGKKLKGKLIIASAPIAGSRKWICKRPKDQTPYSKSNDLEDVIKDLKGRGHKYLIWKPWNKPAQFIQIKD